MGNALAYRRIHAEMREAWVRAPLPPTVTTSDGSRTELAAVEAIAVAHGWTARVFNTGDLALLAADRGYTGEVSPLIRTLIEHSIGLWWLARDCGSAYQALARQRSREMARLQEAQSAGWTIEGEDVQQLLQNAIDVETDGDTLALDHLLHVRHQAEALEMGSLYQGWLIETPQSHASISSALQYYEVADDGQITLHRDARHEGRDVEAAVCLTNHTALAAYDRFLAGNPLAAQLAEWSNQLTGLAAQATDH